MYFAFDYNLSNLGILGIDPLKIIGQPITRVQSTKCPPGGGGTLRISGCGCAARTLEPLAYIRASFSWILLPYTTVNSWFPWSSQPTGQFREK